MVSCKRSAEEGSEDVEEECGGCGGAYGVVNCLSKYISAFESPPPYAQHSQLSCPPCTASSNLHRLSHWAHVQKRPMLSNSRTNPLPVPPTPDTTTPVSRSDSR